jgi:hypothetical protein
MKAVGILLAVVGVLLMAFQIYMGATKYHLTRSSDMHKFILWMAVGLVLTIIGAVMARRGSE